MNAHTYHVNTKTGIGHDRFPCPIPKTSGFHNSPVSKILLLSFQIVERHLNRLDMTERFRIQKVWRCHIQTSVNSTRFRRYGRYPRIVEVRPRADSIVARCIGFPLHLILLSVDQNLRDIDDIAG